MDCHYWKYQVLDEDVLQKLPGNHICSRTFIYTGALFFSVGGRKTRKTTIVALMAFVILALNGCAGIEPEKRMYPLALGVEWSEDGWTLIYGMPELPSAEGQEKEESQKFCAVDKRK